MPPPKRRPYKNGSCRRIVKVIEEVMYVVKVNNERITRLLICLCICTYIMICRKHELLFTIYVRVISFFVFTGGIGVNDV